MPRPSRNPERIDGHFPPETIARIERVLRPGEIQAAFMREAVEAELRKRESAEIEK